MPYHPIAISWSNIFILYAYIATYVLLYVCRLRMHNMQQVCITTTNMQTMSVGIRYVQFILECRLAIHSYKFKLMVAIAIADRNTYMHVRSPNY